MREEDDPQAASVEGGRVARRYAEFAADPATLRAWAAANPGNRSMRAEVARAILAAVAPGPLLDVGCGTGWWLAEAAAAGHPVAGADIQEARVQAARRTCPGAELRVADAAALPWPDGHFAATTLLTVLSSLRDRDAVAAALAEAARVTRADGLVVVWEPRLPSPRRRRSTVARAAVRSALGTPSLDRSITLLPPLARRLGPRPRAYARLAALAPLRTHYLIAAAPR